LRYLHVISTAEHIIGELLASRIYHRLSSAQPYLQADQVTARVVKQNDGDSKVRLVLDVSTACRMACGMSDCVRRKRGRRVILRLLMGWIEGQDWGGVGANKACVVG
jgi:hypothetical protein